MRPSKSDTCDTISDEEEGVALWKIRVRDVRRREINYRLGRIVGSLEACLHKKF